VRIVGRWAGVSGQQAWREEKGELIRSGGRSERKSKRCAMFRMDVDLMVPWISQSSPTTLSQQPSKVRDASISQNRLHAQCSSRLVADSGCCIAIQCMLHPVLPLLLGPGHQHCRFTFGRVSSLLFFSNHHQFTRQIAAAKQVRQAATYNTHTTSRQGRTAG
jgi:hypothetical protein